LADGLAKLFHQPLHRFDDVLHHASDSLLRHSQAGQSLDNLAQQRLGSDLDLAGLQPHRGARVRR